MSEYPSESSQRHGTERELSGNDVLVPGHQVQMFLRSLKEYSDPCTQSRKEVLEALRDVKVHASRCEECATSCKATKKNMDEQLDERLKGLDEKGQCLPTEMVAMKRMADKAADDITDCKLVASRVAGHEKFVRSVVEVFKTTASDIKRKNTRSIYATSVCR